MRWFGTLFCILILGTNVKNYVVTAYHREAAKPLFICFQLRHIAFFRAEVDTRVSRERESRFANTRDLHTIEHDRMIGLENQYCFVLQDLHEKKP